VGRGCLWLVTCVVRKKLLAPGGGGAGRPPGPPMPGSTTGRVVDQVSFY